ncbi:MAG: RHS domain-containing protein [Marinobacter sp.]|nr:RHS domain-containing protein [Marinobacter sp.]
MTYYHNDQLGSPLAATDSSGAVVWQQAYDPWGESVTTTANNRAFTGKWRDLDTGLNDYFARWQSSSIGRFTQIDDAPWHESNIHSFNRYAYANNSPYRYKDPDGNLPVDTIWDALNVVYDGARIAYGNATGNDQMVAEATTDMAVDLSAMFVPYLPAGSSKLARVVEGASEAKKVHKNSLDYVGETHVYRVKGPDGSIYKVGESAQGTKGRDGASIRAEQQARRLTRETGETYTSEIRKTFPDKASARDYETRVIERFRRMHGQDTLPGNKTNR